LDSQNIGVGQRRIIEAASNRLGTKSIRTHHRVVCRNRERRIVWVEEVENLVTTAGVNKLLDATFKTGLASPAWYVGLIKGSSAPTFAITDTIASHSGWTEIAGTDVSQTNRQAWTAGTISGGYVDNSASQATYNMLTSVTLQGLFMADNNTIGGTTGTLYGEAAFSTSQAVQNGYTVSVTSALTITAG